MAQPLLDAARASQAVQDACGAACDALVAGDPGLMPSVYLERGGRLRCLGVRGYWQIRDGMSPAAGVTGRTFRTGRETLIQDVRQAPDYLEAGHDVQAELCVPVRWGGRVVGVLNVEARRPLSGLQIDAIRRAATALGARIDELGGPPPETPAQLVVRRSLRLAQLFDVAEIEFETVDAALDLAPLRSAALARVRGDGSFETRAALGPLAGLLLGAPQTALEGVYEYVRSGSSCYTADATGDELSGALLPLWEMGAKSIAAFGIALADGPGFLLLADGERVALSAHIVELLELLAAHASSCVRTADALADLGTRAATDPLTGLGHHATFHASLAAHRPREAMAVMVVDIDGFKDFNDTHGHQAGDRLLVEIASALAGAVRRGDSVYRVGGDEFAALVRVADAEEALDAGRRLRAAVNAACTGLTVSIGVAMPWAGESDASVIARADRALYVVKAEGRDGVALAPDATEGQQSLPL